MRHLHQLGIYVILSIIIASCAPAPTLMPANNTSTPNSSLSQSKGSPEPALPGESKGAAASPTPQHPWVTADLVDINTGKHFTINDYKGKVVLVDGMATWCPTCFKEALQIKDLHKTYGDNSDLVTVSLGFDSKEDAGVLKDYTQQFGFNWPYAITPQVISYDIGNSYGALFLDPTLVPMLIVDRQGIIYTVPFGYKDTDALKKLLDPFLNAS
jgi:thiol-disulfide isomerase/thioredoxin